MRERCHIYIFYETVLKLVHIKNIYKRILIEILVESI